ncbi:MULTISPECIES: C40 family peptidase [Streptomyces]|uniref:C40 family peptidase n=1 Tax=Streptomyces TaxID=1883 RepID=UPI000879DBE0|nr:MULTISPECIES: C40 family peptidase [unclassified Streptomyces]REH22444.1 NlpC/P60 family protein [Streptomyces sp. 2221.1]WTC10224.1 NlpC/P60 family protein [Streptomyces anthocyanicus]WTE19563.1 NlpC/P60 family protein [Streptomyces anthocyanicus]SDT68323.1 NlpC/P60 family protein [Streptomyces sp. 2114.2]
MRTGKRVLTTTAVTVVCAITVLAAPGTAFADPGPSASSSPSQSPGTPGASTTPSAPAAPSATPGKGKDLEAVRKKLDGLYRAAASATEEYNAAEEKAEKQNAEIVELAKKIVKGQEKLDGLKDRAGAAARSQYRTGGLPDGAKLILSDDPEDFLDGTGRVIQGQRATKGLLGELTRAQRDLKAYAADASARFKELEANRKAKATAQKKIEKQIAAAEKLESELEKEEKERLARLEREAQAKAQTAWLDSGILKDLDTGATERGRKAVEYATAQIGKPYQWGAEGPKSYDCSGLTSQAWVAAGQTIPRTSQQQWKQLRHVAVEDMRPGDLIIYFDDASHVGMYVGDGSMVHAPRPGRSITVAGAGSMPILGVVRPDTAPERASAPKE